MKTNTGVSLSESDALIEAFEDYFNTVDFNRLSIDYNLPKELESIERDRIQQALTDAKGNQTKAAEILKIGRTCLIAKMKKYGLVYSET